MVAQEKENVEPFIEEETEEALLGSLMWRAEGKVTVPKTVRGGILADDVGYGKTAIVLGLLDASFANINIDLSVSLNSMGVIPSKATLIVVPRIMVQQWRSEIAKFLGDKYNVLAFSSAAALRKTSIGDIRNSDIILVSWSVFDTAAYYQHLRRYAGAPEAPDKPGRNFDDWFHRAQGFMKQHVRVLAESGPPAFLQCLRNRRAQTKNAEETHRYAPSKRLRGKQYALANKDRDFEMKDDLPYTEISSSEESSGTSDGEYENPIVLKAKIDHLLRLIPPKQFEKNEGLAGEQSSSHGEIEDDWEEFGINGESQSWEAVLGLPFHAFHFNRLVIDEFTYAKMDRLTQLLTLQARSKWVLSGTPPLNDFADVNTIAPFLGVHLGIDADDDINSQHFRLKELRRQRSDAETFESFRAPRSEAWHRRRHELAQTFLDRFARRNVAEIDEIPATEHIVLVRQSPAEKAIYLELYKQLMTYNRQLRRVNGRGGDQAERIDEIIAYSSTPEEALLKRCTSLALQGRWDDDGQPEAATCASLIRTREEQLNQAKNALKNKLKLAAWLYCSCKHEHDKFSQFMNSVIMHNFGDKSVTEEVDPLLAMAVKESKRSDWRFFYSGFGSDQKTEDEGQHENADEGEDELMLKQENLSCQRKTQSRFTAEPKLKPKPKSKSKVRPTLTPKDEKKKNKSEILLPAKPTEPREFDSELREVTGILRKLVVELVHRKRALRFLTAVRKIQTNPNPQAIPACDNCQTQPSLLSKLNILGSCGHALCSNSDCTLQTLEKEECAVDGCRGSGKKFNIINALTLGCDTTSTPTSMSSDGDSKGDIDRSSRHGGTKLEALINIITKIPVEERALLFVQFPDLMTIASKALSSAGILHIIITPTDQKASSKIEKFQKEGFGDTKVLILNLGGEMAAGLNLQCANHVIFLSPFLAETQYDYDSVMIQAVGRSRRYGQTRHVHVYHLLAKMTIDVNVFQERRGNKVLVERGGRVILVDAEEAAEEEAMTCQGPAMVVDNAV
jgi:SNF2 family DNA or RNA helicase